MAKIPKGYRKTKFLVPPPKGSFIPTPARFEKKRGSGWFNQSRRHSLASKGVKTAQNLDKRLMQGRLLKTRRLEDTVTGEEFSAHAGDYWQMNPNDVIEGVRLIDADGVVKETVRKKDLVDEILFSKKTHSIKTSLRKGLKKSDIKASTIAGHEFDNKGRFIVGGKPSDTWTFEGIADRWGRKVLDWEEYAKNPHVLKEMKGSFFVMDMDNGTSRTQGKKINKDSPWW